VKPSASGAAAVVSLVLVLSGCHSYRIDATIENRTGAAVQLLEVDYPSASFGTDGLASGAAYLYRFQVRGRGPIKVQYTESASRQTRQISGPELFEGQQGRLEIVLLPEGKAEFLPSLSPAK
jgi:hypothetical protein